MLMYRTCRCCRRIWSKLLHTIFHLLAAPCIALGFVATWDYHNLRRDNDGNPSPIPNFYSLHSWMGLTTMGLFALQVIHYSGNPPGEINCSEPAFYCSSSSVSSAFCFCCVASPPPHPFGRPWCPFTRLSGSRPLWWPWPPAAPASSRRHSSLSGTFWIRRTECNNRNASRKKFPLFILLAHLEALMLQKWCILWAREWRLFPVKFVKMRLLFD